ncbi:MAG: ATP-binding protein [Anaerolineales bacterium]
MAFYQEIATVFNSAGGSIAYHTILGFSILGALYSAYSIWRRRKFPQGYRLIIGLSFLLGIRVILILGNGLLRPNSTQPLLVLYVLDQAAIILGMIFIFWLWAFPEPHRSADTIVALSSLIILSLILIHVFMTSSQAPSSIPGFTWIELIWFLLGVGLLLTGSGLLFRRQPNGWVYGIGMAALMLIGYILHFLFPVEQSVYSGSIRITQMAAYPLLMSLPFRFALSKPASMTENGGGQDKQERRRSSVDLPLLATILDFSTQRDAREIRRDIVKLTSHAMIADICLLVEAPDPQGNVNVQGGYDLIRQEHIPEFSVQSNKIPLLSTFIRREQTLHLPASSTSRDLINLSQFLQISRSGHLLATPLKLPGSETPKALVLLSPFSNRQWIKRDQAYLTELVNLLHAALVKDERATQAPLEQAKQSLQKLKAKYEQEKEKSLVLQKKIDQLERAITGQKRQGDQETPDPYLKKIWAEEKSLKERTEQITSLSIPENRGQLKAQLKVALKEIASLREDLSQAEKRLKALHQEPTATEIALSRNQQEALALFAQEVQEPLNSLVEYSDVLLDQSLHVLNSMQRKMLQRMKTYKEQIDHIVRDILPQTKLTPETTRTGTHPASFKKAVQRSLSATKEQIQGKEIALQFDIPQTLRPLDLPQDVLDDIIVILLANALQESPPRGEIAIKLRTYKEESEQSFAHIQITDQGEGFSASELPYIIDHDTDQEDTDQDPSQGIRLNLSSVKDMVEKYDGRIWVDNHPKQGKILSVLIPFLPRKGVKHPNPT